MRFSVRTFSENAFVLIFLCISIVFVLKSLPIGDEPDYGFRVLEFANWLGTGYYRLENIGNICSYSVHPLDFNFWSVPRNCLAGYDYIAMKILSGLATFFICYLVFILMKFKADHRLLLMSFCLPGVWTIIFAAGAESIAVTLSLFMMQQKFSVKALAVLGIISILDFGTAFMFVTFKIFLILANKFVFSKRFRLLILIGSIILLIQDQFKFILEGLFLFLPGYVSDVYKIIIELEAYAKYTTVERFVSLFLMTGGWFPSHLKLGVPVFLSVLLMFFLITRSFWIVTFDWRKRTFNDQEIVGVVLLLILILSFFPNYSNFKYYIFLMPLFMQAALDVFGKKFYFVFTTCLSYGAIVSSL